ncbi:MAG: S9 family peptidase [Phycisphaerales bacterium]|nr:S9 family peptidase [Phycisphaerales bacterium]
MIHALIAALAASLACPASAADGAGYPATRAEPVQQSFHGEQVTDEYRWLEALERDSPEVSAWTTAQNDRTRAVLDGLPCRTALERALEPLMTIGSIGTPQRAGGLAFWTERQGTQNQPVLYVAADPTAAASSIAGATGSSPAAPAGPDRASRRVLLDVNALDAKGLTSLDWFRPSEDGRLLAFATSVAGSEMSELHVMDTATGEWLADVIPGKVSLSAWAPSGRAFLYSVLADPKNPYSREIRWHELGRDPRQDPVLYRQREPSRVPGAGMSRDGRWIVITESRGWQASDMWIADMSAWMRSGEATDGLKLVPVATGLDARFSPAAIVGDTMYALTTLDAPNGRLLAIDCNSPAREGWREVIPTRADAVLGGVSYAAGLLVADYEKDATSRIERFSTEGTSLGEIALPGIGSAGFASEEDRTDGFIGYTSFNEPRSIYTVDFRSGRSALWARPEVPVDPSRVSVTQVFVTSTGGAKIPMFLVHKAGLKPTGDAPTLLYAYGGFNVSMTPAFSAVNWPWYEAGGVYALACLRGGGEYGESWHRDGMLDRKQNVFDDLYACAKWLIDSRWTSASRLAVKGGSNGGLLTGVAATQRPDLFCAAISAVPLLDMLRYHEFLMAKFWVPEYGSSADAAQYRWLRAYSPYHNIKQGTTYPAMLITAGENDSRVHPLHARKMAARMQALAANDPARDPILLWVDRDSGHGQGKPLALRIRDEADQWAFLMWQTGLCN